MYFSSYKKNCDELELSIEKRGHTFVKADLHNATESRSTLKWDLWAWPVSVIAQDHMFLLHSREWKKSSTLLNFFQSLANDDVKVNKTQRISPETSDKNVW